MKLSDAYDTLFITSQTAQCWTHCSTVACWLWVKLNAHWLLT